MDYQEAMELLSQCSLGALLIAEDSMIIKANGMANSLLHGKGRLEGLYLCDIAPALCTESETPAYANTAFGEYLLRCPTPVVKGLPDGVALVIFRNASNDACHDMLMNVVNRMNEAVVLCDTEGRIWLLNDAAVKLDGISTHDVLGKTVEDVYVMLDGSEMAIPRVIRDRKPLTNLRQYYATRYGKSMDIISNNYPIVQNGQMLGAYNLITDMSALESLHKKVIDLQDKLLHSSDKAPSPKKAKSPLTAEYHFNDIIGRSPAMCDIVTKCQRVAKSDSSVMIYGETGTGKELFAQSIHNASRRADGPFLAINCAAIPENLLESLLFGTEKGAYTGAERRPGLFEQASGGTLLLDEINSMNIGLQSKLLRVLQEGRIRRVGGSAEIKVDVRVLSNINIPPQRALSENILRADLFYRLSVVTVTIPPLRERKEDISVLSKHFIMKCNQQLTRTVRDIDKYTLEQFYSYNWPGNVRELQHAIEHAMNIIPYDEVLITPEYLPDNIQNTPEEIARPAEETVDTESLNSSVKEFERQTICRILIENKGNIAASARAMQMSRQNLQYRIKRYQIDVKALMNGAH